MITGVWLIEIVSVLTAWHAWLQLGGVCSRYTLFASEGTIGRRRMLAQASLYRLVPRERQSRLSHLWHRAATSRAIETFKARYFILAAAPEVLVTADAAEH
jgi:hypothetical protein